jgi:hypothetical protein
MLRVVLGRTHLTIDERNGLSDLQFSSQAAAASHSERSRAVTIVTSRNHHKEADSDTKDASTDSLDELGRKEELERNV